MAMDQPQIEALARPWRRTPLVYSTILSKHAGCQIYLKLDNLQPSGSFKSRGVGNFLLSHVSKTPPEERSKLHFYISSGGNAGLACAHAAVTLGAVSTIVVPLSTTAYMIEKVKAAGASEVIQSGASWAEADQFLREDVMVKAKERGEVPVYVPPFDAEEIWEGNSTIVSELEEDFGGERPAAIVCSVGGGGLFSGIVKGLDRASWGDVKVLAVETHGADSLALSLREGSLSALPAITSIATSLGARMVAAQAYKSAQREQVKSVVMTDQVAMEGCVRFADDERIMVEAACGVSVSLCYGGRLKEYLPHITEQSKVVIEVCGGSNVSVGMLHEWALATST